MTEAIQEPVGCSVPKYWYFQLTDTQWCGPGSCGRLAPGGVVKLEARPRARAGSCAARPVRFCRRCPAPLMRAGSSPGGLTSPPGRKDSDLVRWPGPTRRRPLNLECSESAGSVRGNFCQKYGWQTATGRKAFETIFANKFRLAKTVLFDKKVHCSRKGEE